MQEQQSQTKQPRRVNRWWQRSGAVAALLCASGYIWWRGSVGLTAVTTITAVAIAVLLGSDADEGHEFQNLIIKSATTGLGIALGVSASILGDLPSDRGIGTAEGVFKTVILSAHAWACAAVVYATIAEWAPLAPNVPRGSIWRRPTADEWFRIGAMLAVVPGVIFFVWLLDREAILSDGWMSIIVLLAFALCAVYVAALHRKIREMMTVALELGAVLSVILMAAMVFTLSSPENGRGPVCRTVIEEAVRTGSELNPVERSTCHGGTVDARAKWGVGELAIATAWSFAATLTLMHRKFGTHDTAGQAADRVEPAAPPNEPSAGDTEPGATQLGTEPG